MLSTALFTGTLTLQAVLDAEKTDVLLMDLGELLRYRTMDDYYLMLTRAQKIAKDLSERDVRTVWQFLASPRKRLVDSQKGLGSRSWAEICRLIDLWPKERPSFESLNDWPKSKAVVRHMTEHPHGFPSSPYSRGIYREGIYKLACRRLIFKPDLVVHLGADVFGFTEKRFGIIPRKFRKGENIELFELRRSRSVIERELKAANSLVAGLDTKLVEQTARRNNLQERLDAILAEIEKRN